MSKPDTSHLVTVTKLEFYHSFRPPSEGRMTVNLMEISAVDEVKHGDVWCHKFRMSNGDEFFAQKKEGEFPLLE